jgi:cell division septum initiation protein DivIVA
VKEDFYFAYSVVTKLDQIVNLLEQLLVENKKMTVQMDALVEAVAAEGTVVDSAVTLITGFNASFQVIIDQLAAVQAALDLANVNTVELQKVNDAAVLLHDEVEAKTAVLAAAVAAVP